MCRWLAYSGNAIPLETLLFTAEHNLIEQSRHAQLATTPTNGDGFGVGWYGEREFPGLYRSIRPAWNDFNLHDIAAQVDSRLFLAHLRATSHAAIQETNCHPFRYRNWLFVHNGYIREIEKLHRQLLFDVAPELFGEIRGSTDSELMFHLALTFGLEQDPLGGLARMVGLVEATGRECGVEKPLKMTIGLSDGESIWAVRYASDGEGPSLYHSRDVEDLRGLNPQIASTLGEDARVIVSEPIGRYAEVWEEIPQSTSLCVRAGEVESLPFEPVA